MPDTPERSSTATAILNAAATCFLNTGYHGTSMRDIAKAAGYRSVAGLYNHYPDKEAVFVGVLAARHPYDELANAIDAIEGDTLSDLLPRVLHTLTDFFQSHSDFFRLVLIDYLEFDAIHARALIMQMQERMVGLVMRLHNAPDMPADLSPVVLVRGIAIQVLGFALTEAIMPPALRDALDRPGWQALLSQTLLHGLLNNPNP